MENTTGLDTILKNFNFGNLPPEGSPFCGEFFKKLWEDARYEKINRLDLHKRFMELHRKFRGEKIQKGTYPTVGANYLFKTIQGFCAMLTEKYPRAEITTDSDVGEEQVRALDKDVEKWWLEKELQGLLYASVQNMEVYGTTIEKFTFDRENNTSKINIRDPFNFFPAPEYKLTELNLPYCCDAYFLEPWEISQRFDVPDNIIIPTDANEQLFGRRRETTTGESKRRTDLSNLPSNYAEIPSDRGKSIQNKTLVVEIWIKDGSIEETPIMGEVQAVGNEFGEPIVDDQGRAVMTEGQVGVKREPRYPGGIRKVTFCPALLISYNDGILDDVRNPNVNWELIAIRQQKVMDEGIPVPDIDEATGQPVVDPETGQVVMTMEPVDEDTAYKIAHDTLNKTYLYNNYPFSAVASLIDTTQWWGFSIIEQLEELQGKAELLLTKYFAYFDRAMFPILLNPSESGVDNSKITNVPGLVLRPTIQTAPYFMYIPVPSPPIGILDLLQLVLFQMDVISGTPEVTEGRRPKGVSAASAIIALQDKAATLFQPQVRAVDKIVRNRGRAHISMVQNFGTEAKPIKVDDEYVRFLGIDLQGAFEYMVESGSSAPITKAGRRQQYIELFRIGAMPLEFLLRMLEVPQVEKVIERWNEQNTLPGAIDILIQAGMPEDEAHQLYQYLMLPQGGTGRKTAEEEKSGGGNKGGSPQRRPTGPDSMHSESQKATIRELDTIG